MKEYPVGTVCIVVSATNTFWMIGKEVTITGPLRECSNGERSWIGYDTDFENSEINYCPEHRHLRPKYLPNNDKQAFESFLNKITKPLSDEEMSKLRREDVVKEKA